MTFKPLPQNYKLDIDLLDTNSRQDYARQLVSEKNKVIESAFLPLIKGNLTDYKGRLHCIINHDKIEMYTLDEIPVLEIYPMDFKHEYDEFGQYKLTAFYKYKILYEEGRNEDC